VQLKTVPYRFPSNSGSYQPTETAIGFSVTSTQSEGDVSAYGAARGVSA